MNTYLNHPGEYNRLMETARKRASELRGEAVTDLWNEAGGAARNALRSATRLVHSIARHQRARRDAQA